MTNLLTDTITTELTTDEITTTDELLSVFTGAERNDRPITYRHIAVTKDFHPSLVITPEIKALNDIAFMLHQNSTSTITYTDYSKTMAEYMTALKSNQPVPAWVYELVKTYGVRQLTPASLAAVNILSMIYLAVTREQNELQESKLIKQLTFIDLDKPYGLEGYFTLISDVRVSIDEFMREVMAEYYEG